MWKNLLQLLEVPLTLPKPTKFVKRRSDKFMDYLMQNRGMNPNSKHTLGKTAYTQIDNLIEVN